MVISMVTTSTINYLIFKKKLKLSRKTRKKMPVFKGFRSEEYMFLETKREAMSRNNFPTTSRRNKFMFTDRRDYANLQKAVEKLETRKIKNVKKYQEEINDWNNIFKQFELEKEGLQPFENLITGDKLVIKSSVTARQETTLKSVRRSLAPRTTREASSRPVLNYRLISKPPAVPHRIKLELLKREDTRIREENENQELGTRKFEDNEVFLDDAVIKYANLRKEVEKEMKNGGHVTSTNNTKPPGSKVTKPGSIPCKPSELGTKNKASLYSGLKRSTVFNGTVSSQLPPLDLTRPGRQKRQENKHPISSKIPAKNLKKKLEKDKSNLVNQDVSHATSMSKVGHLQSIKECREDNEIKSLLEESCVKTVKQSSPEMEVLRDGSFLGYIDDKDETVATPIPRKSSSSKVPQRQRSRSIAFALSEETKIFNNSNKQFRESDFTSSARLYKRQRSRSIAFLQRKEFKNDDKNHSVTTEGMAIDNMDTSKVKRQRSHSIAFLLNNEGSLHGLGPRTGSLPALKSSRRNSTSSTTIFEDKSNVENVDGKTQSPRRRNSVTYSKRLDSGSKSGLSTDKLQEIITEKIIGQLTNVQKRHSISSNQKTSILKSYTRMLQSQLKMDEVPESESPDFKETPFMHSKKEKAGEQETEQNYSPREPTHTSSLWKSHLQFGAYQSTVNYSDIEEENVLSEKARRRLGATFFDAAGTITRKEKTSPLAKLRKKQRKNAVYKLEERKRGNGKE